MAHTLKQIGRWIYVSPKPTHKLKQILKAEFSYIKKGSEYMPNPEWGNVKLYQEGRNRFPVGLLPRCEQLFKKHEIKYKKLMISKNLSNFKPESKGLYDFQKDALRMVLSSNGGILQMPTGSGKTRTAIAVIETLKYKTLVIVPTLDLKSQWDKQLPDYAEVKTYQSLKSKKYLQQFDLVIFDECHNTAAKTLQLIGMNLSETAVTLGLSATPFMRDDDNLKVESVLGPIIYKISLRQLINEGYLVDALVHYHKLKPMEHTYQDYNTMYDDYVLRNKERNAKIVDLAREAPGHVLILIKKIEHGNYLKEILELLKQDVVFLNGSVKKRDDTDHKIIIATSIFDEGIDIPHLETLILGGGGKSAIKTTQRIGRVLRTYPEKKMALVHDFKDNCKWLDGHYDERREIYKQDFEIIDVD